MKLAYENSASGLLGASYIPRDTVKYEQAAGTGASPTTKPVSPFQENRGSLANRSLQDQVRIAGVTQALQEYGLHPATNLDAPPAPKKPPFPVVPDAGTGYATNGAQYGAP